MWRGYERTHAPGEDIRLSRGAKSRPEQHGSAGRSSINTESELTTSPPARVESIWYTPSCAPLFCR